MEITNLRKKGQIDNIKRSIMEMNTSRTTAVYIVFTVPYGTNINELRVTATVKKRMYRTVFTVHTMLRPFVHSIKTRPLIRLPPK